MIITYILFISGKQYLALVVSLMQKNVKASTKEKEFCNNKFGRMYQRAETNYCPVEAWKLYSEKLKNVGETLFPAILKSGECSIKKVLGKNTLSAFMSNLSTHLKLSRRYTNHCIRVTLVNTLRKEGFSRKEVALITGHKNENSVAIYERVDSSVFHRMSNALVNCASHQNDFCEENENVAPATLLQSDDNKMHFSAPPEKNMRISADGISNRVVIEFFK